MESIKEKPQDVSGKSAWYDGRIFTWIPEKFQRDLYKLIASKIPAGASALDVACATGGLSYILAERGIRTLGIDLSPKNIETARKRNGYDNLEFFVQDASEIDSGIGEDFDYAVISYALHEMPPALRPKVVTEVASRAKMVILADYAAPYENFWTRSFVNFVEFMAGAEHNRNFLNFKDSNGLIGLAEKTNLKILNQEKFGASLILETENGVDR